MERNTTLNWISLSTAQLEQIEVALDKWEANDNEAGETALTANDICKDPTLLPFLEQRIRDLKGIAPFFNPTEELAERTTPSQIGPIEIVDVIARKSFCDVYRGNQADPEREVAVKVLHLSVGSPSIERAFRNEIEILAKLRHPGIAEVYLAGTSDNEGNPLLYYAMEYLNGPTLTEHADVQQLNLHDRVGLFLEVCRAVAHAHHNAVIHRDLKPTNILTHNGRPKILDFGISKLLRETGTVHTNFGMGTPGYISPEQFTGESIQDTRSDIFSLGVTLYELLSGEFPYARPVNNLIEAAKAISDNAFVPLSHRLKNCPPDLDAIAGKCLHLKPKDRYQSVEMLVDDLQRFMAGDEVKVRPRGRLESARHWIVNNPWISASLISASVCLILVTTLSLVYWKNAESTAENLADAVEELTDLRESDRVARSKLDDELTLRRRSALNQILSNSDRSWNSNPSLVANWLSEASDAGLANNSFAWRAIAHRTKRVIREFKAHNLPVSQLSVSADGSRLASAGKGGDIKVWDLKSTKKIMHRRMGLLSVRDCELHPSGEQLLVLNQSDLTLLDVSSGSAIHSLPASEQEQFHIGFSPKGDLVFECTNNNQIRLLKGDLQSEIRILTAPFGKIMFAKINADSSQLLAIGPRQQLVVWDIASGEIRFESQIGQGKVHTFSATDDFETIATAGRFDHLHISTASSDSSARLLSRGERFDELLFSDNGQWLLSVGRRRINGRSIETGWETQWTRITSETPTCVQFFPSTNRYLVGLENGCIQICGLKAEPFGTVLTENLVDPRTLSISNDGKHIAVAGSEIALYDAASGKPAQHFRADQICTDSNWNSGALYVTTAKKRELLRFDDVIKAPAVAYKSKHPMRSVATGNGFTYIGFANGEVRRLNSGGVPDAAAWQAHDASVTALAFDETKKVLVSGSETGEVAFWNQERELISRSKLHQGAVTDFALLNSIDRIYSSSRDRTVGVIDTEKMSALPSLRFGVDRLRSLAVSPDGETLSVAAGGNDVLVCDAITGEFQTRLSGHDDTVVDICFSHCGRTLYSVSLDGTLRCWTPQVQ